MSMLNNVSAKKLNFEIDDDAFKSRTKQCHKCECDINVLVARALADGGLNPPEPVYGDVSHITPESFMDMKNTISEVKGQFELLPSSMRREYGSPEGYIEAMSRDHEMKKAELSAAKAARAEHKEEVPLVNKSNGVDLVSEPVESEKPVAS